MLLNQADGKERKNEQRECCMVKQIFWKKEIKDYQGSMETDFMTE